MNGGSCESLEALLHLSARLRSKKKRGWNNNDVYEEKELSRTLFFDGYKKQKEG